MMHMKFTEEDSMRVQPQQSKLTALLLMLRVIGASCVTSTSGGPSSPVVVGETRPDADATSIVLPTRIPSLSAAPTPDILSTPVTPSSPVATPKTTPAPEPTETPIASPAPTPVTPTSVPTGIPTPIDQPTPTALPPTSTPSPVVPTPTVFATPVLPTPSPRPPDLYDTPEAALERAAELGCSGWRGTTVNGQFGYFPCGDLHLYEALVTGGPYNLFGEGCTLASNPDVRFTVPITEIDKIALIIPSGSANGGVIKPHGYIHPTTIGGTKVNSFIYAPADSWLQSIAYYKTFFGTDEYLLTFFSSCEISWRLDHILTPVDSILAVAPSTPATSSATTRLAEPIFFKAGDLVARSRGAGDGQGPWDFGAYNTTVVNTFANQNRYASATNTGQSINTVCPYDLYDEPLRSQFHALFGGNSGPGYPKAACPAGRDTPGALAGKWFAPDDATDDGGFAITLEGDDGVMMTGGGLDVRVPKGSSTWADPALVTTSHCYNGGQWGWAFLELLDVNTLAVAGGTGGCPATLPSNYSVFVR